eukprot:5975215-Pleurochrysis_carterae.AAC.2
MLCNLRFHLNIFLSCTRRVSRVGGMRCSCALPLIAFYTRKVLHQFNAASESQGRTHHPYSPETTHPQLYGTAHGREERNAKGSEGTRTRSSNTARLSTAASNAYARPPARPPIGSPRRAAVGAILPL